MFDRAEGAVEDAAAHQGAAVRALDDGAVEDGGVVCQPDLEQCAPGAGECLEVTAFRGCRVHACGDERG